MENNNYISMLGLDHFLYIFIVITFGILMLIYKDKIKENERSVSRVIALVCVGQLSLLFGYYFISGTFTIKESLPFHISRINTFLGIFFLTTKNKKYMRVLSYFAIFALLSFAYPVKINGITHPLGISFLINHLITLLIPYYGVIVSDIKLTNFDKIKAFKYFQFYLAFTYIFNRIAGSNYFYLMEKPVLKNLNDFTYLVILEICVFILFSIQELFIVSFKGLLEANNKQKKSLFFPNTSAQL